MKTELSLAAIAVALLAFCGPSQAQQMGYAPYMGYVQPMGYAQPMAYLPQTAYMAAPGTIQPLAAMQPLQDPVAEGCVDADCAGMGGDCENCCCDPCCCGPRWCVWGDFLYIRARDAEVAFAVPTDGPIVAPEDPAVQIGPTGVVDFDYEPNIRLGFNGALGDCGRIGMSYTSFEAATAAGSVITAPYVVHSLVSHPGTDTASQQFLAAEAAYSMDFDLIDADFARTISCGCRHRIACVLGARYAGMQQDFQAIFGVGTNEEMVTTGIRFDGGGIRVGLDTEFYSCNRCWLVYCRSAASFVGGDFSARYAQDDVFGGTRVVYTDWRAGRLVTMLDLEIGVGWTNCKGTCRVTGGYMVSGWLNTVNTDEWIKAVQADDFTDLNHGMTFDGLVARAQICF